MKKTLAISQKAIIGNSEEAVTDRKPLLVLDADSTSELSNPKVGPTIRSALKAKGVILSETAEIQQHPKEQTARLIVDETSQGFNRFEVRIQGEQLVITESLGMASAYDSPFPDAERRVSYRLNNTFFVYKEYPEDKPTHLLLGLRANIPAGDTTPESTIVGWIPTSRTQLWNTGEACRWNYGSNRSGQESRQGICNAVRGK